MSPGFNVISGQNNAGKTAFLEALGLGFTGNPHRSILTVPAKDSVPNQVSWIDISFVLPGSELREMVSSGLRAFQLVKPDLGSPFAKSINYFDDSQSSASRLLDGIFSQEWLTFRLRRAAPRSGGPSWTILEVPSYGTYPPQRSGPNFNYFSVTLDESNHIVSLVNNSGPSMADIGIPISDIFARHVYRFLSERMKVGQHAHGANPALFQNAFNLPEVLNLLQANPSRFRELNEELRLIFPQVKHISVNSPQNNVVEIMVWPHDPETKRQDLAVPLLESGTGIGQVLAILYVVMTSDRPQVIIIDEPQSFLHPGAARKLIEFLKRNDQHQFIVATHSATIIASADPKTIILARLENGESTLQQLDPRAEKTIQETLSELGVRLSDSFGADNILWVEGRTEEKCFRLIVERILRRPFRGTEILGIRQTGDLESRDAKKIFEIYRNLTSGASLLPPAVAFILDQECRGGVAKRELITMSGNRARFLPRRMFENYLLNPVAITHVLNAIDELRPSPLGAAEVSAAIESKENNASYYCANAQGAEITDRKTLAWIIHDFTGGKRKGALKD